ncbi:MAG: DUF3248 domain-containing protein [Trueperaceae bacterium]
MSDGYGQDRLHEQLSERLADVGVEPEALEELASNLLWRIGRVSDDGPVTVRVGLASSAGLFQHLPRLRGASDAEIEAAVRESAIKVEWVGSRPRSGEH